VGDGSGFVEFAASGSSRAMLVGRGRSVLQKEPADLKTYFVSEFLYSAQT